MTGKRRTTTPAPEPPAGGVLTDEQPDAGGGGAAEQTPEAQADTPPEPGEVEEQPDITVTLVQLGTGEQPLDLPAGSTVGDLLREAGLSGKRGSVLVNAQAATLDDALPSGATVVFANNITGGRH